MAEIGGPRPMSPCAWGAAPLYPGLVQSRHVIGLSRHGVSRCATVPPREVPRVRCHAALLWCDGSERVCGVGA